MYKLLAISGFESFRDHNFKFLSKETYYLRMAIFRNWFFHHINLCFTV